MINYFASMLIKINLFSNPVIHTYLNYTSLLFSFPRVVTGEKNSPTVARACRKRRLKWVLPRLGVGAQGEQPCLCKKFNRCRNLNNCKVVEALRSSGNEEEEEEEEELFSLYAPM
jgi:hypothetical protein